MAGFYMHSTATPAEDIDRIFESMALAVTSGTARPTDFAIRVSINEDFFLSIAMLRALRLVWSQWLTAIGQKESPLHLHVCSPAWTSQNYEPHGNMLKGTTAAISAILGGCDALTIDPGEFDSNMTVRAARNISNVLREEAHLSKVADPIAGSYFVDHLTQEIASTAWKSIASRS